MSQFRKYVIRNNKKNKKDRFFACWGRLITTNETHPIWCDRRHEDVYKFFSKSEARFYARQLVEEGYKVKIIKLKRAEWIYDGGDD